MGFERGMGDIDHGQYLFSPIQSLILLPQQRRSHVPVSRAKANCPPALQVSNFRERMVRCHVPSSVHF